MYNILLAVTQLMCSACGRTIDCGTTYGRRSNGGNIHCGMCTLRFGAAELRTFLESVRDRVESDS